MTECFMKATTVNNLKHSMVGIVANNLKYYNANSMVSIVAKFQKFWKLNYSQTWHTYV